MPDLQGIQFSLPDVYNTILEYDKRFFAAIRDGEEPHEDAVVGFRTEAPCLAANKSYSEKKIIGWEPLALRDA